MKILILNGPNLNLLGVREKSIYGSQSFELYFEELQQAFPGLELSYFQSNTEGVLIDKLHEVGFSYKGIVLNAAAYTHTSVALSDAIKAIETPVVEVHISNVFAREAFRHKSMIAPYCIGSISGFGLESYRLALQYFERLKPKQIGFGAKSS
ncbi:type II 3-dehydroquinate dehydratase [Pontibacter sp. 13R65]|uniref:type II 3-dehydroquinate dehydratase n=1 Tax=Pontibacter sp. 13R65 TaxID=3127458 RepID=UPI00301DF4B8